MPSLTMMLRSVLLAAALLAISPWIAWADCASDCSARYFDCARGGNPDACLAAQGICLNRCTLEGGPSEERHGAIAYSVRTQYHGYSYGYESEKAASNIAVQNCRRQNSGATDCQIAVTFSNACGALARGDKGVHGAEWGHTGREAAAKALAKCRARGGDNCKIDRQICSQ